MSLGAATAVTAAGLDVISITVNVIVMVIIIIIVIMIRNIATVAVVHRRLIVAGVVFKNKQTKKKSWYVVTVSVGTQSDIRIISSAEVFVKFEAEAIYLKHIIVQKTNDLPCILRFPP